MRSFSNVFRQKLELAILPLSDAYGHIFEHEELSSFFADYLFLHHSVIRASVPLMRAALNESRHSSDAASVGLVEYFEHHIPEECHHDDWLVDDMQAIGVNR